MNSSIDLSFHAAPDVAELLHDLITIQAETSPDVVAVVSSDIRISYRDLDTRANQLAHALRAHGVGPETQVGVCLHRSPELLVVWLGVLKAGAAYVPLDPSYPADRLSFMLADARVSVVLTEQTLAAKIAADDTPVLLIDGDFGTRVALAPDEPPAVVSDPDQLAYVIYTSGSTGQPKGVAVSHRAVMQLVRWHLHAFEITAQDRATMVAGLGFDAAVWEVWPYLCAGATLYLVDEQIRPSAELLHDWLIAAHITIAFLPTPLAERALRLPWPSDTSLRALLTGGDQLHSYAPADLPFALINNYGPTECAVVATSGVVATQQHGLPAYPAIGRPLPHVQAYVLDTAMQPVEPGAPGELYLGGDGLARGYLFRPDLTAERFVPDPFSPDPGARLYRTGDRVCWQPDATLAFLGRIDDQIKLRGYRIELGEIEAVLRSHAAVQDAVVAMREDDSGVKQLVAYVVENKEQTNKEQEKQDDPTNPCSLFSVLCFAELRQHLGSQLPAYMVPSAFVLLDALPLTSNGKVDRRALPLPTGLDDDQPREAPQTAAEQALAAIWRDVLGRAFIGRHDNFFALGGDSIVSIQIVARARQRGIQVSSRDIFDYPTVAELAAQSVAVAATEVEQGPVSGDVPLTPIQRWFFAQAWPAPQHFNQTFVVEARDRLDVAVLEQAIDALVQHHDALRLRYQQTEQGWQQWHDEELQPSRVTVVDLIAVPHEQHAATFEAVVAEQQASLDLATGPLVRGTVFTRGAQPDWLLLVVHHLVVDGVSWRILLEDLEAAYTQRQQQRSVELPAKTTSFQTWARRQAEYARTSDELQRQVRYWNSIAQRQIAALPIDSPGQTNDGARVQTVWASLSAAETTTLLHEVPSAYRTQINDVLLTALALTFADWTGNRSLLVNLEGHGREALFADLDISRTVGWFTSIFPVLLDIEQAREIGAALVLIKEQLHRLPQRGIGYGILRFLSGEAVDLAAQPQPQVSFNYLGQFDRSFGGAASRFRLIRESHITDRSPLNPRPHLLEVDGYIDEGRLRFVWTYSDNVYRDATVARLAESFMEQLRALIAHCQMPAAGSLTPSDVPLAGLDQPQLDRVLQRLHEQRATAARRTLIAEIEDLYALSPLQEGMLVHKLRVPDDEIYTVQYSCVLTGHVDTAALKRAWQLVVEQHPILRTSFSWEGLERPVQIVHRSVQIPWHEEDWRALDDDTRQQRLDQFLQVDRARGFAIQTPPLMRMALFRLGDSSYRLVWSFHHLLLDGWSTPLVIKDVFAATQQLARGTTMALDRVRGYRDYIAWLQAQSVDEAERFWRAELRGLSEPTALGVDHPLTSSTSTQGVLGEIRTLLPEAATTELYSLARRHKLTVNTLVQGMWALLLSRYSGASDVLFGATVATRPAVIPDVERIIGPLINTLPVRIQVQRQAQLMPWLSEIQARQSAARRFDHVSLVEVQRWSEIPASVPLFESLLVFEHYPASGSALPADSHALIVQEPLIFERTSYPLTIAVGAGAELMLKLIYDPARFEAQSVERIAAQLEQLLHALAATPDLRVGELPWIARADVEQIATWNRSAAGYPREAAIHELIEGQAQRTPDRAAIVFAAGTHERVAFTYDELNRRANQLAHYLRAQGVGPDTLVALMVERSLEMIVGMLAILKAGGAYLPLDPAYPRDRLQYMLSHSRAPVILTQDRLVDQLPEHAAQVFRLDADWKQLAAYPRTNPARVVLPHHLAYVIYTSGSTGRPKGVMVTQQGVINLVHGLRAYFDDPAVHDVGLITSISFDISVNQIFPTLIFGRTLHIIPDAVKFNSRALLRYLHEHQIHLLDAVPSYMQAVLNEVAPEQPPNVLRYLLIGGEKIERRLLQAVFGQLGHAVEIVNIYGLTEISDINILGPIRARDIDLPITVGRPLQNNRIYILNPFDQLQPVGIAGEICIAGESVSRGYLFRPDLAADRFVPCPFEDGQIMVRTGDLGRWRADGTVEILGRIDHQVKLRGYRIELDEISARLRQHPAVHDAVTVMQPGADGASQLVAYVVENKEQTNKEQRDQVAPTDACSLFSVLCSPQELRAFLAQQLPEFMVPSAIVVLDALPLLPNGKLDRKALPAPSTPGSAETSYVAPRTETERRLAAIWADVLKIEHIGVADNFFDLGGHSLLAMQLLVRIQEDLKAELPLRTIFEQPSIAALAPLIEQARAATPSNPSVPLARVSREAYRARRSSVLKDEAGNTR